jgi:hypothetical protein
VVRFSTSAQQFRFRYNALAPCFTSESNLSPDDDFALMPLTRELNINISEIFNWNIDQTYKLVNYEFQCDVALNELEEPFRSLNLTARSHSLRIINLEYDL